MANEENINSTPSPEPGCDIGIAIELKSNQSNSSSLSYPLPASDFIFAFDGAGGCTSSEIQTLEEALHWIEDYVIDVYQPCLIKASPPCSFFKIESGKITPVSIMQLFECLPWETNGQVLTYDGSKAVIGYPQALFAPNWLNLIDTATSSPTDDYQGIAGSIPIVNDTEDGLTLQSCLPETSVCPGADGEVLTTVDDGTGELTVVWKDAPVIEPTWLKLLDTSPSDTYSDRAGQVPIVNDTEDGLTLGCLPPASICPGTDGQIIQAIPDPNSAGDFIFEWVDCLSIISLCPGTEGQLLQVLPSADDPAIQEVRWIDCLDPQDICPGDDGDILVTRDDGTTNLVPTWEAAPEPLAWSDLTDTRPNTLVAPDDPDDTYLGRAGQVPIVDEANNNLVLGCLPPASICPGTEGQIIQTLFNTDDPPVLENQWINCLDPQDICPGNDGDILVTRDDGTTNLVPTWEAAPEPLAWSDLTDTRPNTLTAPDDPDDTYLGRAGQVPIVDEVNNNLVLGCLPPASICPGTEGQIIQTLFNTDDPPVLENQWINCLDPQDICPGNDGDILVTRDDGTTNLVPTWEAAPEPLAWSDLTDTRPNTLTAPDDPDDTYLGRAGQVPIVDEVNNNLVLGCLPPASICPGTEGQIIQTLFNTDDPPVLENQWINCLDPQDICPGTADQILVTRDNAGTLVATWETFTAGAATWLDLPDTDTTYAGKAGLIPIYDSTANRLLLKCLPPSKICVGEENQIIQSVEITNPDNTTSIQDQFVNCVDVSILCPSPDDCARLVQRNGTIQWVSDFYVNLCDVFPQPDPLNNEVTAATITDSYAGFGGAIAGRVREPEEDGVEFVTQADDITPPAEGQVLVHYVDNTATEQTHYETPIHFEQCNDDPLEQHTLIKAGNTQRNKITTIHAVNRNAGIVSGTGDVLIDPTATDPLNHTADPNYANAAEAGYVITKSARYVFCLRLGLELTVLQPQTGAKREAVLSVSPCMGVFRQAPGATGRQEYRISETTWNVGDRFIDTPHTFRHFGSGCIIAHLSRGDVIQPRVLLNTSRLANNFRTTNGDFVANTISTPDETSCITITELPGFDPALVV